MLQAVVSNGQGHKDFDTIRTMLQLFEGGRLKRDKVHMMFESARLRRENDSLRKEVESSKKLQQKIIEREIHLKKKLIDLKNELVRIRVAYDMGEYQSLVTGSGKSPNIKSISNTATKKQVENNDLPSYEKVKQYVEDLAVLRENLLKIEFRNIELEELMTKKDRDIEELQAYNKDIQAQLKFTMNRSTDDT